LSFTSLPFPFFFFFFFRGLRWAGQVALGLALLPHSTHCVDTDCGGYLRRVPSVCAFFLFFRPPFFPTRWTLAVVCGWALLLGCRLFRGNGFVGSSPCEAAVVESPLRRQLSGNLPHQCHRQALEDGLHGVGFCPSMEVGRGSVCDLEEDRLSRGTQATPCGQGEWGEPPPLYLTHGAIRV